MPASDDPHPNHEPESLRGPQVGTGFQRLFWPSIAGALFIHIIAFTLLLRTHGFFVNPFHGFTSVVFQVGGYLMCVFVVRLAAQFILKDRFEWKWSLNAAPLTALMCEFLVILVAMSLLPFAYSWPKLMVQVLNHHLWDSQLARLDRFLCLGIDPNQFLLTVFEGAPRIFSRLLDHYYGLFVLSQSLGAAWFLTDPRARNRAGFGLGFIVLWMAGTWCYVAVPALGPAYAFDDLAPRLFAVFPDSARAQAALWATYSAVRGLGQGGEALIVPHLGIAAMPSLHTAVHFYLYLWSVFSKSRLRPIFFAMTIMTFVASVATCWHYAVDGLAGAVLAVGSFFLGVVIAKRFRGRPQSSTSNGASE